MSKVRSKNRVKKQVQEARSRNRVKTREKNLGQGQGLEFRSSYKVKKSTKQGQEESSFLGGD